MSTTELNNVTTSDSQRPPFPSYKSPDDPSSGFATEDEALEAWEAECEVYLEKYGGAKVRDPWEEVPMMSSDSQTFLLPPIAWEIKRTLAADQDTPRSQSPEPIVLENPSPKRRLRTLSRVKSIFARSSRSSSTSSTSSKSPRSPPQTPLRGQISP
ncbi:unnamed protein product [Peniophora sp. CBMAI 1063]|nr:unnamed protein product [Peniophora sp. CBMAI 1063]